MTKTIFTFYFVLLFISCGSNGTVYDEHVKLPDNLEWYSSDARVFAVPINDNSQPMEFIIKFRYATGFQYDHMTLRLTETDPEGNSVIRDVSFKVRDENGEFIGEAGYDIIDLEYVLDKEKQFPVLGTYTYRVEQTMPTDPLYFAMEVGLIVRKIEGLVH